MAVILFPLVAKGKMEKRWKKGKQKKKEKKKKKKNEIQKDTETLAIVPERAVTCIGNLVDARVGV